MHFTCLHNFWALTKLFFSIVKSSHESVEPPVSQNSLPPTLLPLQPPPPSPPSPLPPSQPQLPPAPIPRRRNPKPPPDFEEEKGIYYYQDKSLILATCTITKVITFYIAQ